MPTVAMDQFKTPATKLARFFRISRDTWKAKALQYRKRQVRLENHNRKLIDSREQWKQKAVLATAEKKELEKRLKKV